MLSTTTVGDFPSILTLASLFIDQILKSLLLKWSSKRALQSSTEEKNCATLLFFRLTTRGNVKGEQADFCTSEVQKYQEVPRSTKKYREIPRSTKKYEEVPRSTKKYERSTLYSFDFYPQTEKKVFRYCAISKTLLPITE
jgi:hypothetical protein